MDLLNPTNEDKPNNIMASEIEDYEYDEEIPIRWRREEVRVREAMMRTNVECDFELRRKPLVLSCHDGEYIFEVKCKVCGEVIPLPPEQRQSSSSSGESVSLESYVKHALAAHSTAEPNRQFRFFTILVPSCKVKGAEAEHKVKAIGTPYSFKLEVSAWLSVSEKHRKLSWTVERRFSDFVKMREDLASRNILVEDVAMSRAIRYGVGVSTSTLVDKRRDIISVFLVVLARRGCTDPAFFDFIGCANLDSVIENPTLEVQNTDPGSSKDSSPASTTYRRRPRTRSSFPVLCCCVNISTPAYKGDDPSHDENDADDSSRPPESSESSSKG